MSYQQQYSKLNSDEIIKDGSQEFKLSKFTVIVSIGIFVVLLLFVRSVQQPLPIVTMSVPQIVTNMTSCDEQLHSVADLILNGFHANTTNNASLNFRLVTYDHMMETSCSDLSAVYKNGTLDAMATSWYESDKCSLGVFHFVETTSIYFATGAGLILLPQLILDAVGFGVEGVTADSFAALWQSFYEVFVSSDSLPALLQSIGAKGPLNAIAPATVLIPLTVPVFFALYYVDIYGSCQDGNFYLAKPLNFTAVEEEIRSEYTRRQYGIFN